MVYFSSPKRNPGAVRKPRPVAPGSRPRSPGTSPEKRTVRGGNRRAPATGTTSRPTCRTRGLGHQQDFAGGAADLHGQIGIGAELAVALIDLANGLDVKHADHECRAARVVHRKRFVADRLRGAPLPVRRKERQVEGRACPPDRRAGGRPLRPRHWRRGCPPGGDGRGLDFRIGVQEKDIIGIGGAPARGSRPWSGRNSWAGGSTGPEGNSPSSCALPSDEPLSTTMIWRRSRSSEDSIDSRQRRKRST